MRRPLHRDGRAATAIVAAGFVQTVTHPDREPPVPPGKSQWANGGDGKKAV